jgi:hypothetical protein
MQAIEGRRSRAQQAQAAAAELKDNERLWGLI